MSSVNHQQASQLLHNKFVVVLGDSIQRSAYKDLVLLLQRDKYLSLRQLRTKGEMSFEQDCLVEGGCLSEMNNGTSYREVRQFQTDHHLVRFYFVTRVFSRYMQSIIEDFRHGLKPDVVIVSSCVWDISRYKARWTDDYKENLQSFFGELRACLPEETLVIWNLSMPLAERIKGGFLVPEIEHKAAHLRYDVIEANFYCQTVADVYERDVLDLHFQFRLSLHHRSKDGVHWNSIAHRWITSLLLKHIAQAWGVKLTLPLTAVANTEVTCEQPPQNAAPRLAGSGGQDFFSDVVSSDYLSFEEEGQRPRRHRAARTSRPAVKPQRPPAQRCQYNPGPSNNGQPFGFNNMAPYYFEPYSYHHQYVMRTRHARHHYNPYAPYAPYASYSPYGPYGHHRPPHYGHHGYY
ncbi:PC-esterase domain-containing protein 1A [Cololabis saira]|uniref:PC-esterase domain-containing protein 1A n=1 Tax=Cololabis saira TaxID=129043 RepID=UPI002AD3821B|nr:PC-esterase domain-containing protein 1A [Cololabis saira]